LGFDPSQSSQSRDGNQREFRRFDFPMNNLYFLVTVGTQRNKPIREEWETVIFETGEGNRCINTLFAKEKVRERGANKRLFSKEKKEKATENDT
jgi:hypothetical protein